MLFIYSLINSSINLLWSCYCYEFMSYLPYLLLWCILHGCQEAGTAYPSWTPVFSTSGTFFLVISYPSWTPVFTTCNCLFGIWWYLTLQFMDVCIHHMWLFSVYLVVSYPSWTPMFTTCIYNIRTLSVNIRFICTSFIRRLKSLFIIS